MTDQTKPDMPEIDFENELESFALAMVGDPDKVFPVSPQERKDPEYIRGVEWLRSFASRILSAERQGGWKSFEWQSIYYYCGDTQLGVARPAHGSNMFYALCYIGQKNTFKPTLEEAKSFVEQTLISELNSLRSKEEEA